jgi:hypothetical protein
VTEITATSGSRAMSHHWTLWKQAGRILDVTTSHNREPCLFGSCRELPKLLIGWCEVAKITATSRSRVASHRATLWKQASRILDVATSQNEEPRLFGSFHERPKSLLGLGEGPKITAMIESRALSRHLALWKQARGRLDVTTCHNRGTLLFWLQSRPFTLAAWVV